MKIIGTLIVLAGALVSATLMGLPTTQSFKKYPDFAIYEYQSGGGAKVRSIVNGFTDRKAAVEYLKKVGKGQITATGAAIPGNRQNNHNAIEELNRVYSVLFAGPHPTGKYKQEILKSVGERGEAITAVADTFALSRAKVTAIVNLIWNDKVFVRSETSKRKGYLMNQVFLDKRTPAKVFCGQSKIDVRKESFILDYQYAEKLPEFKKSDWMSTRYGMAIRDEIRVVMPGVYLGLAYGRGLFLTHFILNAKGRAAVAKEESPCYLGRVEDLKKNPGNPTF